MPTLPYQEAGVVWRPKSTLLFEDTFETNTVGTTWLNEGKFFNTQWNSTGTALISPASGQMLAQTNYLTQATISAATSGGSGNTLKLNVDRTPDTTVTPNGVFKGAQISTQGTFSFRMPVRIDCRAKLAYGTGIRSAFWIARSGTSDDGNTGTAEIDIIEHYGSGTSFTPGGAHLEQQTGLFWSYSSGGYGRHFYNSSRQESDTGFNEFSLIWTDRRMVWLRNNIPYWAHGAGTYTSDSSNIVRNLTWGRNTPNDNPAGTATTDANVGVYPKPWDATTPMRLRLGIELGSASTPGDGYDQAGSPVTPNHMQFEIDYVRVFQLS